MHMNRRLITVQELQYALIDKWNNIPKRDLRTLCLSMKRYCTVLITANGSHSVTPITDFLGSALLINKQEMFS